MCFRRKGAVMGLIPGWILITGKVWPGVKVEMVVVVVVVNV